MNDILSAITTALAGFITAVAAVASPFIVAYITRRQKKHDLADQKRLKDDIVTKCVLAVEELAPAMGIKGHAKLLKTKEYITSQLKSVGLEMDDCELEISIHGVLGELNKAKRTDHKEC